MKLILISLTTIISLSYACQESKHNIIADLNHDGKNDSLNFVLFRNVATTVHVYNSVSDTSYTLLGRGEYNEGSKACFLEIIPIPESLTFPSQKQILDSITKYLLPNFTNPDASLNTIIEGYTTVKTDRSDPVFSFTYQNKLNWDLPKLIAPKASFTMISKSDYASFWNTIVNRAYDQSQHGLLIYYGHNHLPQETEFKTDTIAPNYNIYLTMHGVMVEKDGGFDWVFTTDCLLTGSPQKLRWKSIMKTSLHEHLVFIHQVVDMGDYNQIFVVNLENGKVGSIRMDEDFQRSSSSCFDFEIDKSVFTIISRKSDRCYTDAPFEEMTIPLLDIEKQLN